MKKLFLLASVVFMSLTSCTTNKIDIDGEWKVVAIAGEFIPETLEPTMLTFDAAAGTYNGVTGVNLVNGSYELNGDVLTIGEGAMTRKMGDSISNVVEINYINALNAVKAVSVVDGTLVLKDAEGNALMSLVK